ncbi:uncharacterized protein LOC124255107 isoform X2 [Haliotis rubra]|uniref:uncharacterized protein LOC124255107 isoform X2 n=1 Tax=Haliotis rubra TaxID=36100 RepID=UPI001EE617B4|nr:uncharacterized protein LOC124255107 isoform X2 [Haliotis rubra]
MYLHRMTHRVKHILFGWVKLALPLVAGCLAIFVILLVLKRCGYWDRICKRKKTREEEMEDIEVRAMLPPPLSVSSPNNDMIHHPHLSSHDMFQNRGHFTVTKDRPLPSTPAPLPCPHGHRNAHSLSRDVTGNYVTNADYGDGVTGNIQNQRRSRFGNHGYMTMSSGNAVSCCNKVPKSSYITARHDTARVPVNVCAPILRTNTESECRERYRYQFNQLSCKPPCESDVRDHRTNTVPLTNIYSNSTLSLPDRLRCAEIPVGPFVSRQTHREPSMDEAIALTIASESFEDLASFAGAWWHAQSEDSEDVKDAPYLPRKRCQSFPRHMHITGATYVSMSSEKLPRSHTMEGEYVTLPPLLHRRPCDSYITSGQKMRSQSLRRSGIHDKTIGHLSATRKEPLISLPPPPPPCLMTHEYINAKTVSHF